MIIRILAIVAAILLTNPSLAADKSNVKTPIKKTQVNTKNNTKQPFQALDLADQLSGTLNNEKSSNTHFITALPSDATTAKLTVMFADPAFHFDVLILDGLSQTPLGNYKDLKGKTVSVIFSIPKSHSIMIMIQKAKNSALHIGSSYTAILAVK